MVLKCGKCSQYPQLHLQGPICAYVHIRGQFTGVPLYIKAAADVQQRWSLLRDGFPRGGVLSVDKGVMPEKNGLC